MIQNHDLIIIGIGNNFLILSIVDTAIEASIRVATHTILFDSIDTIAYYITFYVIFDIGIIVAIIIIFNCIVCTIIIAVTCKLPCTHFLTIKILCGSLLDIIQVFYLYIIHPCTLGVPTRNIISFITVFFKT